MALRKNWFSGSGFAAVSYARRCPAFVRTAIAGIGIAARSARCAMTKLLLFLPSMDIAEGFRAALSSSETLLPGDWVVFEPTPATTGSDHLVSSD